MKNNKKISIILLTAIVLLSTGCSTGKNEMNIESTANEPVVSTEVPAQTSAPAVDTTLLDAPVEVPEGGFVFRPAKGYALDISGGECYHSGTRRRPGYGASDRDHGYAERAGNHG